MKTLQLAGASALAVGLVVSAARAEQVMNAEFQTMAQCLAGIKKSSRQNLKIVTDNPREVSGLLTNGKGFACERIDSGSKGTYYHGWFMVD